MLHDFDNQGYLASLEVQISVLHRSIYTLANETNGYVASVFTFIKNMLAWKISPHPKKNGEQCHKLEQQWLSSVALLKCAQIVLYAHQ